jgi:hypothetical protein
MFISDGSDGGIKASSQPKCTLQSKIRAILELSSLLKTNPLFHSPDQPRGLTARTVNNARDDPPAQTSHHHTTDNKGHPRSRQGSSPRGDAADPPKRVGTTYAANQNQNQAKVEPTEKDVRNTAINEPATLSQRSGAHGNPSVAFKNADNTALSPRFRRHYFDSSTSS